MEALTSRNAYTPALSAQIEAMGSITVSVANRWMLGWPDRVQQLLMAGTYLGSLKTQVDREKDVLANEPGLQHLSLREILQLYEINDGPP